MTLKIEEIDGKVIATFSEGENSKSIHLIEWPIGWDALGECARAARVSFKGKAVA